MSVVFACSQACYGQNTATALAILKKLDILQTYEQNTPATVMKRLKNLWTPVLHYESAHSLK